MATIDIDDLRDCLEDYCGSASASGLPAAVLDVVEIEDADGYGLCEKAEELGVDLEDFTVDE